MKIGLLLILIFSSVHSMAGPIEFTGKLNENPGVDQDYAAEFEVNLEKAKINVIKAFTELELNLPAKAIFNKARVRKIIRVFNKSKIYWNTQSKKYKYCGDKSLAYAVPAFGLSEGKIFFCPAIYSQNQDIITQVLLHEAAHFTFPGNECQASVIEIFALYFSDINYPLKSAYWSKCKLDRVVKKAQRF
ncbi:MAG: hypothetical protein ACJAS4_000254 [Bacteriovoracaceae bacterium]|jgi:hypothetical protein